MVHNIHINKALDLFDINCSIHCNALYEGNFSRNKCQIIQVEAQSCSKSRPCYVLPCIGIAKNCKGSEFITVTLQSGQSEDKVHFAHSKQRNKLREPNIFNLFSCILRSSTAAAEGDMERKWKLCSARNILITHKFPESQFVNLYVVVESSNSNNLLCLHSQPKAIVCKIIYSLAIILNVFDIDHTKSMVRSGRL